MVTIYHDVVRTRQCEWCHNGETEPTDIMIVGEAWGKDEKELGEPFVGASGHILDGVLKQAGINRGGCVVTNVFNLQPRPTNDVKNLCDKKINGIPGMPSLVKGKYVRAEYAPEVERLYNEVKSARPNVIFALGATAAWSLLHSSGIRSIRGSSNPSHPAVTGKLGFEVKILGSYHPAAVMRDYTLRPILLADTHKVLREAEYPEIRRPLREVWIEPTIEDLYTFESLYFRPGCEISSDIETKGDMVTCVGFSPREDLAICVPFFDAAQKDGNYWRSHSEEVKAWKWVRKIWTGPYRHTGQNFMYDMHRMWRSMGMPCFGMEDDTMLIHHALQPEMEKGLGFLGSVYTDESPWKLMGRDKDTLKRED